MAQLPPKFPSLTQNWPSFPFHTPAFPPMSAAPQHNSWVDEFLEFSSARRNSHRRSVSDPIAFVEECRVVSNMATLMPPSSNNIGFEKLDDEQLTCMFSDDVAAAEPEPEPEPPSARSPSNPSSTNPTTPSDQNSENDDKAIGEDRDHQHHRVLPKKEPDEEILDTSCKSSAEAPASNKAPPLRDSQENIVDPKRIKRILANRQSAQRSRVRKLQYISELERSVTSLQTEVSALSPRVAFLDHQRLLLNVDNSALRQRIAALAQDKIFKDAHQEALKKEIERLRKIYNEQTMKKMESNSKCSNQEAADQATVPPLSALINKTDCSREDQAE